MNTLQTLCLAAGLLLLVSEINAQEEFRSVDIELTNALFKNDLRRARSALERGANPEVAIGNSVSQDAMCAAIEQRGTEAMELLFEYGARPDYFYGDRKRTHSTPLACAIAYSNPDAFAMLLSLDVDTEVELCPECKEPFYHTYITHALSSLNWPMVLELVTTTRVDERELRTLKNLLSKLAYSEAHPWSVHRAKVIDWLEERDSDFVGLPATPMRPGKTRGCVQSYRDAIEGVLPGSICPE